MAEGSSLLNCRRGKLLPRVQIPPSPPQLLLTTVVYSWGIRTAVPVITPKRTEETPPDVNIAGSGGMAPLRINIEPCAPIWPTHWTPVIT